MARKTIPAHLQGLLEIGRALRAGGELEVVLAAVASAVRQPSGFSPGVMHLHPPAWFSTGVLNRHRPAWDDLEVVVVEGSLRAREQLLGATTGSEEWAELLD